MSKVTNVQANQQGLFTVNANQAARQQGMADKKSKTIFAGDLNMGADSIFAKKQKAQRDAMKIIADAFRSDLQIDQEQQERLDNIAELKQKNADARAQLKDIDNMQSELMEEYGITEDSQEYQDLELLRKAKGADNPLSLVKLTEEEQNRYEELKGQELTEYQQRALALDEYAKDTKKSIQEQIEKNKQEIGREESAYHDTKMERLKSAPMAGAVEDAEAVLEAANKEIFGDLIAEAKEHIDEKTEEEKRKQKEKEEEKKEEKKQEALREARELEREILLEQAGAGSAERAELQAAKAKAKGQAVQQQINGDVLDKINKGADKSAELEKEIRDILEKMRLLQEDIKGAAVDNAV